MQAGRRPGAWADQRRERQRERGGTGHVSLDSEACQRPEHHFGGGLRSMGCKPVVIIQQQISGLGHAELVTTMQVGSRLTGEPRPNIHEKLS